MRHSSRCRPATISHVLTSTAMSRVLRETAVNWADGGKSIKRGTNFKPGERVKYHERAKITQMYALNMQRVRQRCLKFSHVEERQIKLCSLLLVCQLQPAQKVRSVNDWLPSNRQG